MWDQTDFESIHEQYEKDAEDYTQSGSNALAARTLFTTTQSLQDFWMEIERRREVGKDVGDEHKIQMVYLRRGVQELRSLFWLLKHHSYTACYGRLRFILELYTVVRDLNKNKQQAKKKWQEYRKDLKNNTHDKYGATLLTEYFSGKRQQLRGKLAKESKVYAEVYDLLSNIGSHPHSIQSMGLDGSHNEGTEEDILRFSLIFVYALAAQYRRTFEGSDLRNWVEQELDPVMVQAQLLLKDLPLFLKQDLEYTPPVEYSSLRYWNNNLGPTSPLVRSLLQQIRFEKGRFRQ